MFNAPVPLFDSGVATCRSDLADTLQSRWWLGSSQLVFYVKRCFPYCLLFKKYCNGLVASSPDTHKNCFQHVWKPATSDWRQKFSKITSCYGETLLFLSLVDWSPVISHQFARLQSLCLAPEPESFRIGLKIKKKKTERLQSMLQFTISDGPPPPRRSQRNFFFKFWLLNFYSILASLWRSQ